METLNAFFALLGGLLLVLNLGSGAINRRVPVLSQPFVATLFGVAIGPVGLGLVSLEAWGDPLTILEQVMRVTVGLAVVGIAIRLPDRYFRKRARSMAVILGPGMLAMWIVSGGVVWLLLDVSLWVALLIGAILTPTDPVLANTIATGAVAESHVPDPVRNVLSAEAGANDGLAYPFVFLPILALSHPPETALFEWLARTVLWEVGAAVAIGAAVGLAVGYAEHAVTERDLLDDPSMLTVTVALTVAVLGAAKLAGSDGILAAFVAALVYDQFVDPQDEARESEVQESVKRVFTVPAFVLFGTVLPWTEWVALGWIALALPVAILALRRLPALLVLARFVEPFERSRDALFVGWFGPIGFAALYYATLSVRETGTGAGWIVGSLVVTASIVAHGTTATPFSRWFDRGDDTGDDAEASA